MSGHTPGRWKVHQRPTPPLEYGHHVTTEHGLTICFVTYQLPSKEGETTRIANACLIAAAPDLLACAKRSAAVLRSAGIEPSAYSDNPLEELLHLTATVIAAATGEQS